MEKTYGSLMSQSDFYQTVHTRCRDSEFACCELHDGIHAKIMSRILFASGMAMVFSISMLSGQDEPAPAIDMEARRESIGNLENHIAQREERLAEWGRDIVELDGRIEKRVDSLVKLLAGLRDSQDSKTKVTRIKKEAIESLRAGIGRYMEKRQEVRDLIRKGDTAALGDLDKFDDRIIKRVDQIAELTKSIPTHEDVDKYESSGGSYWNGYYYENSRISEEWKQVRRDSNQSDKLRGDVEKALRESLERLDQRRRTLKEVLARPDTTEAAKQLYNRELGQIGAYEEHLNLQLLDVSTHTNPASNDKGEATVSLDQAYEIETSINDARKDLREDVSRLFQSYDQFVRGRAYLEGLKKNLADRKEWLEENDPKAKQ